MKRIAACLVCLVAIAACFLLLRERDDPLMLGGNYGEVLVGANLVLHQGGNLRLYRYHSLGRRELIWPYLGTANPAVMGDLIVFNGGTSDDRSWKSYPAAFAYAGTGKVVELTQALISYVGSPLSSLTNCSFRLISCSNDVVQFDVTQSNPIGTSRPISLSTEVEKKMILAMIAAAHSNGIHSKYDGVKFILSK